MMEFERGIVPGITAAAARSSLSLYKSALSAVASPLLRRVGLVAIVSKTVLAASRTEFPLPSGQVLITYYALSHRLKVAKVHGIAEA